MAVIDKWELFLLASEFTIEQYLDENWLSESQLRSRSRQRQDIGSYGNVLKQEFAHYRWHHASMKDDLPGIGPRLC